MWDNIKINLQETENEDQMLPWFAEVPKTSNLADWIQLCPHHGS